MKRLILFALAAALAAPALAAENRCLMASRVDGFKDATRDSVILTAGTLDFLVTFAGPCLDIRDALSIATVATTSCFSTGDKVVFQKGGGFTETCIARDVTWLPKEKKSEEPAAN